MRLRDTHVVNAGSLVGSRRVEVLHDGNPVTFEFALFAVPQTS